MYRYPPVKPWQFFTTIALSAICLVLAVSAVIAGRANQSLQANLQAQQIEINKGSLSQQVGTNVLRDIAVAAAKNDKLKALLERNGLTLSQTPAASPSPTATP